MHHLCLCLVRRGGRRWGHVAAASACQAMFEDPTLEKIDTVGRLSTKGLTARDRNGQTIFWGELSPCEHLVQIYNGDQVFLDALEGFVCGGIQAGDGVIVIATPDHITDLEQRLMARGVDLATATAEDR